MKKAQIWSMDIIIAVTIFTVVFIGLFLTAGIVAKGPKPGALISENDIISNALVASRENVSIVSEAEINEQALIALNAKDYRRIKEDLGISSDFCIYFEDAGGNLVEVAGITAIGDPSINISFGGVKWRCNGTRIGVGLGG